MLGPELYEAIGRFTVSFNNIENIIEVCTANLLDLPEWEISFWLAQREPSFGRKRDMLKDLLKKIGEGYPQLLRQVQSVTTLLGKAGEIAGKRNDHVHGVAVVNPLTNKLLRRNKTSYDDYDLNEINDLTKQTQELVDELTEHSMRIISDLALLRDAARKDIPKWAKDRD